MRIHFFLLLLSSLLGGVLNAAPKVDRAYSVLFIQSYSNNTPWNNQQVKGLKDGLARGGVKVNVVTEYLNADYWTFSSECVIMRRICDRARQRNTDIIVTSGDEALYTLVHSGDSLSLQLPIVATGIKYPDEALFKKMPNICGFTTSIDLESLLQEAKRLFPNRTEVVCLSDSSFLGRKGVQQVEQFLPSFIQRYPEYSWKKLNVQTQSNNSVISSICYEYNAYKRIVIAPKWAPFLSFIGKNSKAPVFACQNIALTNGVLCAFDAEPYQLAFEVGQRAARILKGDLPENFGITDSKGQLLYDHKQLEFFRVNESLVENEGIILNVPVAERYSFWYILSCSVIVGVLILLVGWLVRTNRRESRRRIHAQTRLLIQHRLVEQHDEFDNIFCSIRDGLITYDLDLRIHFVNHSLMSMLDLSTDLYASRLYEGKQAGSLFSIYMNGENIILDLLKQALKEKKPVPIPEKAFMQEKHKGSYFPVSGEAVPIFAKERMTGVAIVCRNISEEEMQKRFFNLAIEESSIYPWQYNMRLNSFYFPDGLLQRFNGSEESDFLTKDEMISRIHPDDMDHAKKKLDSVLSGQEITSRMSFRLQNVDGSYEWWEFRSTAYDGLTSDTPYMVLGVCQSIQRYKNTEEELIAARDSALQADKLKSAFLANMSHEIRTPLNSIVGFSDLLKDIDSFSPEEVEQFVETINTNCTLLLALINDILDLSRIESGTMEFQFSPSDLSCIMQQVCDSQSINMPLGVELRVDIPQEGENKIVLTDVVRLKQVVNNLVNNAKKFTAKGSITLGYFSDEPGYTTVFVEDTGSGISEEAQKHIFERFYKVDNFTQGAGLGLSICITIIERLRGKISVSSSPGKGTRFEVRVPDANE